MNLLYAPWRHDYICNHSNKNNESLKNNCVFCHQISQQNDEENFILRRFNSSVAILNYYPYNAGHIMIIPIEHQGTLQQLSPATRNELMEVTNAAIPVLEKHLNAEGFNVGINIGQAGGGGIPSHLHIHIVPRWRGDTNFLDVLSGNKVISIDLKKTYKQLHAAFSTICI